MQQALAAYLPDLRAATRAQQRARLPANEARHCASCLLQSNALSRDLLGRALGGKRGREHRLYSLLARD